MKQFFSQDKVIVGLVVALGSAAAFCLLLTAGLLIAHEPIMAHLRWYGGMFVPMVLLLQHYAKRKELLTVTKTIIVTLFVTFIAFLIVIK